MFGTRNSRSEVLAGLVIMVATLGSACATPGKSLQAVGGMGLVGAGSTVVGGLILANKVENSSAVVATTVATAAVQVLVAGLLISAGSELDDDLAKQRAALERLSVIMSRPRGEPIHFEKAKPEGRPSKSADTESSAPPTKTTTASPQRRALK